MIPNLSSSIATTADDSNHRSYRDPRACTPFSSPELAAPAPATREHSILGTIRSSSGRTDADDLPDTNSFSNTNRVRLAKPLSLPPLPPAQTEPPLPLPLSSRDADSAIDTPLPIRSDTRIAAGSDSIWLDSTSASASSQYPRQLPSSAPFNLPPCHGGGDRTLAAPVEHGFDPQSRIEYNVAVPIEKDGHSNPEEVADCSVEHVSDLQGDLELEEAVATAIVELHSRDQTSTRVLPGDDALDLLEYFSIVVAVPKGPPLVVTLSHAFAMKKMRNEKTWVRHLAAHVGAATRKGWLGYCEINALEAFAVEAAKQIDQHLMDVVHKRYRFKDHCLAIKRCLLLGQEDFVQYLMDIVDPELSEPANTISSLPIAAGLLETAVRAYNAQYNGVKMPGINSSDKANPTPCSQAARRNVADDFRQLGVDDFIAEIDLIFQDNNKTTSETLDVHTLGKEISPHSKDALKFFCLMQALSVRIDHYACSATLRSCSDLAILQLDRQVHGQVLKSVFSSNDFVSSSLIYLYSKCEIIVDAKKSFDESCKDSSVTWNSIILGYAQHGLGEIALDLFHEMQELGVEANHIIFVGLLSACSHSGLVKEGSKILKSIQPAYGIPVRMEHYACGVDLFGRAGNLTEAKDLIESMSFKPDSMVWMTLLGACKIYGDMNLASHIAKSLLESKPTVHSTYVILSNMYAGFGYWDGRAMIQRARDEDSVAEWHSSYEKSNSVLFGRNSLLKAVATNIENKIFDPGGLPSPSRQHASTESSPF